MASTRIPDNRACFSAADVVERTGARLAGLAQASMVGVVIDSRRVGAGNLFVALRGAVHDGHDHLQAAVRAGATGLLVEREVVIDGVSVFVVDDTLVALGRLASAWRTRWETLGEPPARPGGSRRHVVAITGSVGKTSTKDLVRAALEGAGLSTLATEGNLNNRIGVPMTLFTLEAEHRAAVIEIGMSVPGEIAELAAMCAPDVGVVTSVADVHTEGVGGIDGVAREKGALLESLTDDGVAIWCADEPRLAAYAERSRAATKLSYGRAESADVRLIEQALEGHSGTRASYRLPGVGTGAPADESVELRLRLLGEAAAMNAAAALAVVSTIAPEGLSSAARAMGEVAPSPHRMIAVERPSGLLVIDDAYNASPRSMGAALETCAALAKARGGRLVAVLGDMLELGLEEQRLHSDVGRAAIDVGVYALIACGERMSHAGRAALRASMESPGGRSARAKVVLLRNVEDAAACVETIVGAADVVLVKGSRGMRMERVVEALLDPSLGSHADASAASDGEEEA